MALTVAVERHLPTTALFSLHVYWECISSLDCHISRTCCPTQTKIKNQPIGKHSQFDWTRSVQFNLTSRRSWNCSETVLEYIFVARQGWPELKHVCKWASLPLRGNQSTKKKKIILLQISDHQQGMVVTVTKTKQSCGFVPAEITDCLEQLKTLKKRMCFDR